MELLLKKFSNQFELKYYDVYCSDNWKAYNILII